MKRDKNLYSAKIILNVFSLQMLRIKNSRILITRIVEMQWFSFLLFTPLAVSLSLCLPLSCYNSVFYFYILLYLCLPVFLSLSLCLSLCFPVFVSLCITQYLFLCFSFSSFLSILLFLAWNIPEILALGHSLLAWPSGTTTSSSGMDSMGKREETRLIRWSGFVHR